MNKDIIFDFCIIPNPFAVGGRNIIFITKSGENFLDRKIVEESTYKDIKEIFEQFGYTETSPLQFESSNNEKGSSVKEMKLFLEDFGLYYSRELEVNIIRDLNNLKIETDKAAQNNLDFIYGEGNFEGPDEFPIGNKTKNKLIESKAEIFKFKHQEPAYRENVTLSFYLFLDFGINLTGQPTVQFGADFKDSRNKDDRNYIRIIESEFERVKDPKQPNSIVLMSLKKQSDFLKESGILYSGYFKYKKRMEKDGTLMQKESTYKYKLAEIKSFLKPEQAIILTTSRMGYDNLIDLSNIIKKENINESKEFIATGEIEHEAKELSEFLSKKIERLSENEEFEEASMVMKDVQFIKEKVDLVKSLDKTEITTEEYFKIFSIS